MRKAKVLLVLLVLALGAASPAASQGDQCQANVLKQATKIPGPGDGNPGAKRVVDAPVTNCNHWWQDQGFIGNSD